MAAISQFWGPDAEAALVKMLQAVNEDIYSVVINGQSRVYKVTAQGYTMLSDSVTLVELASNLHSHAYKILAAVTAKQGDKVFATISSAGETLGSNNGKVY